jgi:acetylornithine/succinyldiaminopimelate/putrescine aminotransferase
MKQLSNREAFYANLGQTSEFPMAIEIDHAQGIYQYSPEDKKYMDLIAGISVSNLGHGYPEIVEAVKSQAEKYMHSMVYGEFIYSPQVRLAEAITSLLPENLNNVFLVNSGSEAVEAALKLAKRFTGRREIISFKNAYHGSTHGAMSLLSDEEYKQKFQPLVPEIKHIEYNSIEELKAITEHTAAVIIEPIQGEAGVIEAKKEFLLALLEKCNEKKCLLIFDEIQTGMGRSGKMFAFQHSGVVPDILLLAKAFGGGMPIGAMISSKEIMYVLTNNPVLGHISTFGGHPVSAAAALANVKVLVKENFISRAEEKGKIFEQLKKHAKVKAFRRKGLMIALELESFELVLDAVHKAADHGLIIDWFLFNSKSIRIAPPLIITNEEIQLAVSELWKVLDEI